MTARIQSFFHEPSFTVSYLVSDPASGIAAVIDPVLDFDQKSGRTRTIFVDGILSAARASNLRIEWVLETHAHADHLSGAPVIRARTNARIGIGEHIKDVQRIFRPVFNATDLHTDGRDFDKLFADGERFAPVIINARSRLVSTCGSAAIRFDSDTCI